VRSVTKAIQSVDPSAVVKADTATHEVEVGTTADRKALEQALAEVGYAPA
jgi:copper chaperone